jgi:hypothetical protein
MVCVGGTLLLMHQFCELQSQRRHETDSVQLHAVNLLGGHVLLAESNPDEPSLGHGITTSWETLIPKQVFFPYVYTIFITIVEMKSDEKSGIPFRLATAGN